MKKNKSFPQKEELQVDKQPVADITQKPWNNKMVCSFFQLRIPNNIKMAQKVLEVTNYCSQLAKVLVRSHYIMTSAYADICKGTVEIPTFSSLLKIKDEGSVASLC